MERVEALHTAARRYCIDRYAEVSRLRSTGGQLRSRQRQDFLRKLLRALEVFTSADLGTFDDACELLVGLGQNVWYADSAPGQFSSMPGPIREEQELFSRRLRGLSREELAGIEPLPFVRTLTASESVALWEELEQRWGVQGYWYPLDRPPEAPPPPDAVAFNAAPFTDDELRERLQGVLARLGVARIFELDGDMNLGWEIAIEGLAPVGGEMFWLDASDQWLIYASHEGSVTVAGRELLAALKEAWPEWDDHLCDSPYAGRHYGPARKPVAAIYLGKARNLLRGRRR